MSLAYRTVPDDEHRTAYRRHLQYAFAPERGPDWDDDPRDIPDEFEPRGLYEVSAADADGPVVEEPLSGRPPVAEVDPSALVVCGALVDFRMRVRGEWQPVGGVSAVASPPERRRRGHVGTLLSRMHEELRARDVALAALWPFAHPFYRRFGYGRTNDYVVHEFPPGTLDTPAASPRKGGTLRRLSADDADDVDALSGLHAESATEPLAVERSADWWRLRVFRSWTDERYVYGWEDDAGRLRSYLAYHVEEGDGDGRRLSVDYWGAVDDEAYRGLLGFLRNHDSQVATVRLVAGDTSLLDRLSDPDEAETTVKPGPMVRVVDIERALAGLSTPATSERVTLHVSDDHHAWNDGVFDVGVDDGRTTCRRVESETGGADPEESGMGAAVGLDIDALSQLVVGARSAGELATLDGVDGDTTTVERLDRLLPVETPGPYLREFF